jgi:hypothetical protein
LIEIKDGRTRDITESAELCSIFGFVHQVLRPAASGLLFLAAASLPYAKVAGLRRSEAARKE